VSTPAGISQLPDGHSRSLSPMQTTIPGILRGQGIVEQVISPLGGSQIGQAECDVLDEHLEVERALAQYEKSQKLFPEGSIESESARLAAEHVPFVVEG